MKKRKSTTLKIMTLTFVAVFLLVNLAACSEDKKKDEETKESSLTSSSTMETSKKEDSSSAKKNASESLPKETKEKYIKKAEKDFELIKAGNYDELKKQAGPLVETEFTDKDLEGFDSLLEKNGTFEKIEKESVILNEGEYVTELTLKYSENTLLLTIWYSSDNDKIRALDLNYV